MATIFMKSGGLPTALSNRELTGIGKMLRRALLTLISGRVTTQLIRRRLSVIFGWPATPRNSKQLPSNLVANRDGYGLARLSPKTKPFLSFANFWCAKENLGVLVN
jgi:hypothetical protein